jgi:hypothetical protein
MQITENKLYIVILNKNLLNKTFDKQSFFDVKTYRIYHPIPCHLLLNPAFPMISLRTRQEVFLIV